MPAKMSCTEVISIPFTGEGGSRPSFLIFPREIRDDIYKSLTAKTYLVYGIPFYYDDHHRKPKVKTKAGLSILRTCKLIKEEASQIMYSKAGFRFAVDIDFAKNPPLPPPKSLTDRMMNIDFILNQASFDDDTRNHFGPPTDLKPLTKATLGRFTGSKIQRRTCGVLLWATEYEDESNGFLSSPMALAMKEMTGFDQVIIEVEDQNVSFADVWAEDEYQTDHFQANSVDEGVPTERTKLEEEGDPVTEPCVNGGITNCVDTFIKQIRQAMMPTLGPCKEGHKENAPGVATSLCIRFLPWSFRNKASEKAYKEKSNAQ